MTLKTNLIRTAGGAVAVAVIMMAGAAVAQTLKAPTAPQPGDCKRVAEHAIGQNPGMAQHIWTASVANKFGPNWSHWIAAQSTAVVFAGNGQYMATGKPCLIAPAG
jgi:hypothetical protein